MNGMTGGAELVVVLIALSAVISFAAYVYCAIGLGFGILATATMTPNSLHLYGFYGVYALIPG